MSTETPRRRRRADRGFTLLETLVALTLLSAVTAAAYRTVGAGARATAAGEAALTALAAAENALAIARTDPTLALGARRMAVDGADVTISAAPGPDPLLWRVTVEARTPGGGAARLSTLAPPPAR